MSDMTKCINKNCELSLTCWRFISPPSENQSTSTFYPDKLEWDPTPMCYLSTTSEEQAEYLRRCNTKDC